MPRGPAAAQRLEVAIVGAGPIGATLAALLTGIGLRVALIESGPPRTQAAVPLEEDSRVLAVTPASARLLRASGAWASIESQPLGHFRAMRVWDAQGRGAVHFNSADLGEPTLGFIITTPLLETALTQALQHRPLLTWHRPAELEGLKVEPDHVRIRLRNGTGLKAALVVGADGAQSTVRALAGIHHEIRDYQQCAVVCAVVTERPHGDTARQRFLATGPLAFLPLADPHRSSIVWSTTRDEARRLGEMPEGLFRSTLEGAFESALGGIVNCGPRARLPLQRAHAERYVAARIALVGDAAHRIHPLAGQGANLGLMDVAALAQVIHGACAQAQDPGALCVLRRYERWRKGENLAMLWAMDAFKELFGTSLLPVRLARNLGMDLTDRVPPVKRWIMRRAMGLSGDLPRIALQGRW